MSTPTPVEKWVRMGHPYEGYEVSDLGRVRRVIGCVRDRPFRGTKVILNQWFEGNYLRVRLTPSKAGITTRSHVVSRLVLEHFVGPPLGRYCNHKNAIKTDNVLTNLEWVTPKENTQHAAKMGLLSFNSGTRNPQCKLTKRQAMAIKNSTERTANLVRRFGICERQVRNIRAGKNWNCLAEIEQHRKEPHDRA